MKRVLFVDDEPAVLDGLQRMLRVQRHEWEMLFAQSGAEALTLMDGQPVDVVVTDMRMPSMDGAQLLHEVMRRHPQTVRIVLSGHSDKEAALRSVGPTHQYLAKPCDAETLKETVARACALRELLHSEHLKGLVSQVRTLPSLPHLYLKIVEEVQSPDASLQRVGEIIAQDIGMTAKVLQLVNSAFFGLRRHITQPGQAVSLLGLETVKALVLSVKLFTSFDQTVMTRAHLTALWEHSLRAALLAKQVLSATAADRKHVDYAFMGGLLHDAGKLVLATDLAAQYREALALAAAENLSEPEAERRVFNATHGEVGAYLLGLWGLPDPIVEAVAFHHHPADCAAKTLGPVAAVHIANALDHETRPGATPGAKFDMEYLARLGVADQLVSWRKLAQGRGEKASTS